MQLVKHTIYGQGKQPVVLSCQHGNDGKQFLRQFPLLHNTCRVSRELLEQYVRIEQDVGTVELAHATAQRLAENARVDVVEVQLPRGIIDANRVRASAFCNLFDRVANARLSAKFEGMYDSAVAGVARVLQEVTPVLFLDVHSMSPYSPVVPGESTVRAVALEVGGLKEYVQAWIEAEAKGTRRYFDIITDDGTGQPFVDERLVREIVSALTRTGVEFRYNDPYPISNVVMTTHRLHTYSGLAVDIPKDLLADGPLDQMEVNPEKIDRMASILSAALAARLSQDA